MIRPLYLETSVEWTVALDDGIALSISAPDRTRRLFPLARLSRVVSPEKAKWTTPALVGCLRHGVPVVFHDNKGDPVGWCFGGRRRETTLSELLWEVCDLDRGADLIEDWRRAVERREIAGVFAVHGLYCRSMDPVSARSTLCNRHYARVGERVRPRLKALERAVSGLVAEALQSQIGEPILVGHAIAGVHLGALLTDLLEWQLHSILLGIAAGTGLSDSPTYFAAATLERYGANLHATLGGFLGSLERYLRGSLT